MQSWHLQLQVSWKVLKLLAALFRACQHGGSFQP